MLRHPRLPCQLVKEWNEKYESPKLKLTVVSEFFDYVEKNYEHQLPVYPEGLARLVGPTGLVPLPGKRLK